MNLLTTDSVSSMRYLLEYANTLFEYVNKDFILYSKRFFLRRLPFFAHHGALSVASNGGHMMVTIAIHRPHPFQNISRQYIPCGQSGFHPTTCSFFTRRQYHRTTDRAHNTAAFSTDKKSRYAGADHQSTYKTCVPTVPDRR
jgi:hypothetical protein